MATEAIDLDKLPSKPLTHGYQWVGTAGGNPCVLVGDTRLEYESGKIVLDTSSWEPKTSNQIARLRQFQQHIPEVGGQFLVYVFEDLGPESHSKRSSRWKFHAMFQVLNRGSNSVRAVMVRRSR